MSPDNIVRDFEIKLAHTKLKIKRNPQKTEKLKKTELCEQ
jgi:hypothetical protein